ncbi:MAG: hypothetical protein JJE55_09815 [Flavobacteriaceae bacterium]|nr:hypothetical protein [Flavobacteriaceae bacterium]
MEITFRTKEESNKIQEVAFLKLPTAERFFEFLRLCHELKNFPSREKDSVEKNNFEIVIQDRKNVD